MSNKDWTGNGNSIFKTLGASNHSDKERETDDFYATEPKAIDILLDYPHFTLPHGVWEPSCGSGCLSRRMEERGHYVVSTDLVYRGYGNGGGRKFLRPEADAGGLHGYRDEPAVQVCYRICAARPTAVAYGRGAVLVLENHLCRGQGALLQDFRSTATAVRVAMHRAHSVRQECRVRLYGSARRQCCQLRMVDMAQGLQGRHYPGLD